MHAYFLWWLVKGRRLSVWRAIDQSQKKKVGGYPRAGDRTKSAAEHDSIIQTGFSERASVREKQKQKRRETDEATMKESGGPLWYNSECARNE